MPLFPSYGNQSIDLLRKSNDWFLYEGNADIQWVKKVISQFICRCISITNNQKRNVPSAKSPVFDDKPLRTFADKAEK